MTGHARSPRTDQVTCIVLVGLPGAGKSTVGPLVADRLGWSFCDLDTEIERAAGHSVAELFAVEGEATFRRLEHDATNRLGRALGGIERSLPDVAGRSAPRIPAGLVLAPGGGWMLDPANLAALGAGARTVYLRVSPDTAMSRMASAAVTRPLLATPDPLLVLERLLAAREATYLQANHTVAAESMSPTVLADYIVALVSRWQGH